MPPSLSSSTHYAIVIDAGSSGSRLQIYSWRDPDLERAEIVKEVRETYVEAKKAASTSGSGSGYGLSGSSGSSGSSSSGSGSGTGAESVTEGKWWWPERYRSRFGWKGKGKASEDEIRLELEEKALRRLVRVGKGVEGDDWVKRVEPGISTQSPSDIRSYLSPLLTHALQQIPPSQHSHTPIYLFATAGMRLLPASSREAILEETCKVIRDGYPFVVGERSSAGPCGENIRVISGEEEGMWGWVAVNYLMDGFGHAPSSSSSPGAGVGSGAGPSSGDATMGLLPLAPLAEPPPDSSSDSVTPVDVSHHSPTFGFLDMGGASTQLAFSPTQSELLKSGFPPDQLEVISLKLLSGEVVEWPVFAASWLGFGTNRVRERYLEQLLSNWKESASKSGVETLDLSTPIPDPCLPSELVLHSTDPSRHPDFIGTGSFSQCIVDLLPLLGHSSPCPTAHCLFAGLPTPHIDFGREDQRGFIGISEYWYTAQQVLGLGGVWDWAEWEKGMGEFCGRSWKAIEEQVEADKGWRGAEVELGRLQLQCFKGAWISNVLHEGIGIPRLMDAGGNDTLTGGNLGDTNAEAERRAKEKGLFEDHSRRKPHFQSMDEVGETAISWTLGKMVIEASKAVPPRSYVIENAWSKTLHGGLGKIEARLGELGIQAMWAYAFLAVAAILLCCFSPLKRRFRMGTGVGTSNGRRGRKPSISEGSVVSPSLASSTGTWCWPLAASRSSTDSAYSALNAEEGIDLTPMKPRYTVGRMRIWSLRLASLFKRYLASSEKEKDKDRDRDWDWDRNRSSTSRHVSMPLGSLSTPYAFGRENGSNSGGSKSQPSSPRSSSGFFVPAASLPNGTTTTLSVPGSRGVGTPTSSDSRSMTMSMSMALQSPINVVSTSPPRGKRPVRSRQNSSTATGTSHLLSPDGMGWNDPPVSMLSLNTHPHTNGAQAQSTSSSVSPGVLTPTAGLGSTTTYDANHRALSRNSSRVNLSEMGLAQRSSRSGTPFADEHA